MRTLSPTTLPGPLRRLAAGAWHVPAGFAFLFRNPRLLPLAILPVVKGALIGLQWALRMHGFGGTEPGYERIEQPDLSSH